MVPFREIQRLQYEISSLTSIEAGLYMHYLFEASLVFGKVFMTATVNPCTCAIVSYLLLFEVSERKAGTNVSV